MAIENIQTSAGVTIAVSTTLPATDDAAGYGALTFTNVGEITDGGEIGGTYGEVTHTPLDTRLVQALKTSFDAGSQTLALAVYMADGGQTILLNKLHSDDLIAVAVTLKDGTKIYYKALVMSFPINIGSVDTIVNTSVGLRINSYPVIVQ